MNGDGLNDVVTSLEAHGFGLAWFEQKRAPDGSISFEQHTIMDDFVHPNEGVVFAALHALALADGDGLKDIVAGKRWWAHFGGNPSDPDPFGPPVIYWFRLVRNGKRVQYVAELINNHSGVGIDLAVADLNKDGLADVLTATRYRAIIFLSRWLGGGWPRPSPRPCGSTPVPRRRGLWSGPHQTKRSLAARHVRLRKEVRPGMAVQRYLSAVNGGANERTRTADLLITSELLYQLSYIGKWPVPRRFGHFDPAGALCESGMLDCLALSNLYADQIKFVCLRNQCGEP